MRLEVRINGNVSDCPARASRRFDRAVTSFHRFAGRVQRAALALKERDNPGKMAAEIGEVSTMSSAALREVRESVAAMKEPLTRLGQANVR